MSEMPEIGGRQPIPIEVEAGKSYWWCACGLSKTQPFCDGSHKVTAFTPDRIQAGDLRGGVVLRLQALVEKAALRRQPQKAVGFLFTLPCRGRVGAA